MAESPPNSTLHLSKHKRGILISLPFLLLLLCLGLLNVWARSVAIAPTVTPVATMMETAVSATLSAGISTEPPPLKAITPQPESGLPTVTATPTLSMAEVAVSSAEVTLIPQPTLPPTATITLLGPPNQSRFMAEDSITFYWTWPLPLAKDQYFGIYVQEETGDARIGRLEEANFGTGYRWQTAAQSLTTSGGEVNTLIKLETTFSDTPLSSSELRTLFILR